MNFRIEFFLFFLFLGMNSFAQHDPGRNAVRYLAKNQTDNAVEIVSKESKIKNSPINEAERYFVLAMAECQRDSISVAYQYARQAVALGLPFERFLAGPRDVFDPLYKYYEFKRWVKIQNKNLLHGPLLGSVTDTSASFWVRTVEEEEINIQISSMKGENFSRISLIGKGQTKRNSDYTTTITVSGLKPDTEYQYTVLLGGKSIEQRNVFRTHPPGGESTRFSIIFGGGAGFTPMNEIMWTTIARYKPRAFMLLGDNVYIDDPLHPMTQHYCYYRRQSQPQWRSLVATTSVYAIYDDHDFGTNDCIPGSDIDNPIWKRQVVNLFKKNWNNPAYGDGEKHPGCWYEYYIGDVHFIMLDGRYYRDLDNGSMLGNFQKEWLFRVLASSKGKFKIIASPVPWSPGVKPGSKDTWDGFPEEREEIFSFIEEQQIDGVLLMSADRHRSDLRKIKRSNAYDLYEVMSSKLTNVHTHDLMENAEGSEFIMGYNAKCSFGLLDFNTQMEDPQVKYSIITIDNEIMDYRVLKLSHLSHSKDPNNMPENTKKLNGQ